MRTGLLPILSALRERITDVRLSEMGALKGHKHVALMKLIQALQLIEEARYELQKADVEDARATMKRAVSR